MGVSYIVPKTRIQILIENRFFSISYLHLTYTASIGLTSSEFHRDNWYQKCGIVGLPGGKRLVICSVVLTQCNASYGKNRKLYKTRFHVLYTAIILLIYTLLCLLFSGGSGIFSLGASGVAIFLAEGSQNYTIVLNRTAPDLIAINMPYH